MENKNVVVENEVVNEVVVEEVVKVEEVVVEVLTDEQMQTKIDELKELSQVEVNAKLDAMIEENLRLQNDLKVQRETTNRNLVESELSKRGLTAFKDVFSILTPQEESKDLLSQIDIIENAMNAVLISKSFQPKETAKQEAYEQAISAGDVNTALKHKLGKLFGK